MNTEFKDDAENVTTMRTKTMPTLIARPRSSETAALISDLDQALCLLGKTKISERRPRSNTGNVQVTKEGSTIVAKSSDTIATVMNICTVETILGMGVIDETLDNRCVGMIDIPTICRYLFNSLGSGCTADNISTFLTAEKCRSVQECMSKVTVADVMNWMNENHDCSLGMGKNSQHVNPFCSSMIIPEGHSLLFAMELLVHDHVRRVVTVDKEQKCTGFYSTSMAISDIRQQSHLLKSFTSCSVQQCLDICREARLCRSSTTNTGSPTEMMTDDLSTSSQQDYNVISLPITATAFEAFQLMIKRNVTGIALMDTQGKLTGTLSIRDLRGLGPQFQHLDRLTLSLKEYKSITLKEFPHIAPTSHWASDSKVPSGCRFVELERGTVRDVLLSLQDGTLSRAMICDETGRLVAILTFHDVIRCLLVCLGVLE
jgi:CBS domain-containing protein